MQHVGFEIGAALVLVGVAMIAIGYAAVKIGRTADALGRVVEGERPSATTVGYVAPAALHAAGGDLFTGLLVSQAKATRRVEHPAPYPDYVPTTEHGES